MSLRNGLAKTEFDIMEILIVSLKGLSWGEFN